MRVVLDTTVFVRALINPHSRCGRIVFNYADRFTLVVSKETMQELLEVIQRPSLTSKYRGLAKINARKVIEIASNAVAVSIQLDDMPATSRDPNDNIFIATAVTTQADYLVSEDRDLLDLQHAGRTAIVDAKTFIGLFEREEE